MKRLTILLLAALLVITGIVFVSGASSQQKLVITVDAPDKLKPGNECVVTVKYSENTGFSALNVALNYPEGFTFVSAEPDDAIKSKFYLDFAGFSGPAYEFGDNTESNTL